MSIMAFYNTLLRLSVPMTFLVKKRGAVSAQVWPPLIRILLASGKQNGVSIGSGCEAS